MVLGETRASSLLVKSSDSGTFDAGVGRMANYRLYLNVRAFRTYTVSWDAYDPADGGYYAIEIFTGVGLGSYNETFSSSGSWNFYTDSFSGNLTLNIGLSFALGSIPAKRVHVEVS